MMDAYLFNITSEVSGSNGYHIVAVADSPEHADKKIKDETVRIAESRKDKGGGTYWIKYQLKQVYSALL